MAGNIYCVNCGAEGSSKCPYCRNIFPAGEESRNKQFISSVVGVPELVRDDLYSLKIYARGERKSIAKEFKEIGRGVFLSDDFDESCICDHEWKFKPGCKSSIGCGHGSDEN